MGFLKKLFGDDETTTPPVEPQIQLGHHGAVTLDEFRVDATVDVVGEQYYPESVRMFRASMLPEGNRAIVMPEPANKFDPNAIVVLVTRAAGDKAPIGHLESEQAAAYRPVFDYLDGRVIECLVSLAPGRGGGTSDGIVLHLGTPGELLAELWVDEHPLRTDHQWVGQTVAFTGEGTSLAGVILGREAQLLLARKAGCTPFAAVTKEVGVCVAPDPTGGGAETNEARELGIPIVAERDFWIGVGIDAGALAST